MIEIGTPAPDFELSNQGAPIPAAEAERAELRDRLDEVLRRLDRIDQGR
jgi:hypothetical protein